ncbi:hypothetical protein DUNSADRAFT_9695 [Dunaliella salina]|uniref:Encoded protein n=1 Tax=Dunaliella salina TaxID=3046 RepID=A0ABQ7GGY2_DUNSA|nr:hypothetical protein DUNSADRAFT_9695 [Dunaliella salina]|eukprot:KAF5833858.1 hypothetical protein DUNSADRAFT_9695 [Dunaliella salina]
MTASMALHGLAGNAEKTCSFRLREEMSRAGSARGPHRAGSARGPDKGILEVINSTNKLLVESEKRQTELQELGRAPKKATAMAAPPATPRPADPQTASELASLQAKILQLEQQLQDAKGGVKGGRAALNQLTAAGAGPGRRRDIWNRFKANVEATKQTLPAIFKKCVAV